MHLEVSCITDNNNTGSNLQATCEAAWYQCYLGIICRWSVVPRLPGIGLASGLLTQWAFNGSDGQRGRKPGLRGLSGVHLWLLHLLDNAVW